MMYLWAPEMLSYMRDASEYGRYHESLAREIAPLFPPRAHVCDAGAGLGYLSLALAPRAERVTAVEINPDCCRVLRENCARRGIDNVSVRCGDIRLLPPEKPYDLMVFSFFGHIRQICELARTQCRGRALILCRNAPYHRFSVGEIPVEHETFKDCRDLLSARHIPFTQRELDIEFGQPLRSREAGRRFFELYNRNTDVPVITDAFLESQLVPTGDGEFPWYLPHRQRIGWLLLNTKDLPEQTKPLKGEEA